MSFITAEGIVIPAATDNYNLTPDIRTMVNSQRTIVSVTGPSVAATVASNMASDGRSVGNTNPLIFWDQSRHALKVMDNIGTYSTDDQITKLTLSSTVSLTTGLFTTIPWTTALIQGDVSTWSSGSNPDRISARQAGRYEVCVNYAIGTAAGTGRVGCTIIQSGSVSRTEQFLVASVTGGDVGASVSTYFEMAALDYIQIQIFQESGTTRVTSVGNSTPTVTVRKI